MATYRCVVCGGVYLSPQANGERDFHACPPKIRDLAGNLINTPNARDENIEQDAVLGKLAGGIAADDTGLTRVRPKRWTLGRFRLSDQDLLTGADLATLRQLQVMGGVLEPIPPP